MKKTILFLAAAAVVAVACNKSNTGDAITLSASNTQAAVGQTVSVTANTSANSLSWSATPASSATKTYSVTTEKTNYFTFSQPGNYVIGVRARHLKLDSVHRCNPTDSLRHHGVDSIWNQHIDSMWHHKGHHLGGCRKGQDSASVIITVK